MPNEDLETESSDLEPVSAPIMRVENGGKPIKLAGLGIHGIAAEAATGGGQVEVITRAAILSTQSFFHRVAPNLFSTLERHAQDAGHVVNLIKATQVLVVIRPDDSADLWIDSAAVEAEARLKKGVSPGSPIFQDDIADITGIWFPKVDIGPDCRVIYLFREGFRFALAFDLRINESLDIPGMKRTLALLERQMRYADLYAMLASEEVFGRMVDSGWFPFIEIMTSEFKLLSGSIEAGLPLDDAEAKIVSKFTDERLDHVFQRWMAKPHYRNKKEILLAGIESFKEKKWVACLKIMLTEIEGLIGEAYSFKTGETTRNTDKLLEFAVKSAVKIAGGDDTLFFPVGFGRYLKEYTFADSAKRSASRHSVGHGRASASDYTHARALQAILTLDQIAFYS